MGVPRLVLHKGKEVSLLRKHPWIFSGAIKSKDQEISEGEIVEVFSAAGKFLATGYYAPSSIAVRILSFSQAEIDTSFWLERLRQALEYRRKTGLPNQQTNVFRLFFGEGDGAPGLIIDNYDGHLVVQAHSAGINMQMPAITGALMKLNELEVKSIYNKSGEAISRHTGSEFKDHFVSGEGGNVLVSENSYRFRVDFVKGQKTGFYIDQRDNRDLVKAFSLDKVVLNAFSYTGGFSVYSLAGGAKHVDSVDASESAIQMCSDNVAINEGKDRHQGYVSDVFDFLKDKKDAYDLMVLDPPAFAKGRSSKHNAVTAYKRLNALAIKNICEDGIIFSFSCSGVVDRNLFNHTIAAAALETGRDVKILQYLSQPQDHPFTPFFPEGEYLKGVILRVGAR
jgi:23S rRNA (cytosine1962-C5)-methyltransferase